MSFPAVPSPPQYLAYPYASVTPNDDDSLPVFGGSSSVGKISDGTFATLWQPEGDPPTKMPPGGPPPGSWFVVSNVLTNTPSYSVASLQIACPQTGMFYADVRPSQIAIYDDPATLNLLFYDAAPSFVLDSGLGIYFYTCTFTANATTKPTLYLLQTNPAGVPTEVTLEINEIQFNWIKPVPVFPTPIRARRVPGRRTSSFKYPGRRKARFMSYQATPLIPKNVS